MAACGAFVTVDDAAQAHDPVADADLELAGPPGGLLDFGRHRAAISRSSSADRLGTLRERSATVAEEIRAGHNSDQAIAAHHRNAFDAVGFHDLNDPIERRILGYWSEDPAS